MRLFINVLLDPSLWAKDSMLVHSYGKKQNMVVFIISYMKV